MKLHILFITFLIGSFALSCKDKATGYKPNVAGKAGELLIVMDDKIKSSPAGAAIQEILIQSYLGLPQDEPHFDLLITPHRGFSSHFKTFRNLVVTEISPGTKEDTILYYKDMWAKPQSSIRILAKDTASMKAMLLRHELKIISFFNKAERDRSIDYFKKVPNAEVIESVKNSMNIQMSIPASLTPRNTKSDDFIWLGENTDWGSQGFLIYSYPYIGEGTFSREYLLNKRDSILNKNVPGPAQGSYMTTEYRFPPIYKQTVINEVPTVELRGLWKVQGDMMGGPFILHAHHDAKNNRVVVTEGFVYCPEKPDKRNKIRQMEALLYTFSLN